MEKKQNFSRKREAILEALRETKSHPTAEWIYQQLKPSFPDLSLGTVYRNLSRFKEDGTVVSVGVVDGQERYDADVTPHSHFVCESCGAVLDVDDEFVDPESDREVSRILGVQVLSHQVIFRGYCGACMEKLQAEKGQ
ncbi:MULTISPECIES: Fur family transcriptional regulator [Caproicibacterium]|uniref:Transcriptional repressor n=1 Tax=Caproicibacterium argilliputei TaxID=3030016 RepID=A0AA97H3P3_9FIRM|nr:transcriptional repressor [Caproicibacterium argilliputei]WOC33422.1 transcriptional repressor [Caproicibacterium argilliputei]